jgi:hypothetical protein
MVRALLAERKTQTRRIIKPQPTPAGNGLWHFHNRWGGISQVHEETLTSYIVDAAARFAVGDRLWVRENWQTPVRKPTKYGPIYYPADKHFFMNQSFPLGGNRPSIHMPRWASRLTLLVTGVKVERLSDISDKDAIAEGIVEDDGNIPDIWYCPGGSKFGVKRMGATPQEAFRYLWEAINGAEAWDENPWVVAVTFTVHQCNIDSLEVRL